MAGRKTERTYLPDYDGGYETDDMNKRPAATYVDESNLGPIVFQDPLELEAIQTFDDPQTLREHPELREYAAKLKLFEAIELHQFAHYNANNFRAFKLPFSKLKLLIRQRLQQANIEYLTSGSTEQLPNVKEMYTNAEKIMTAAKDLIEKTVIFNANQTSDHFITVQEVALNYISTCARSRLYFNSAPHDSCLCIVEPVKASLTRYVANHADRNIAVHSTIASLQFARRVTFGPVVDAQVEDAPVKESTSCCWYLFFCCKPKGGQSNPYRPVPLSPPAPK